MIGGTVIEYGRDPRGGDAGFILYHCTTHGVDHEAQYDDTGTDLIYHRITIHVTGLVHGILSWTQFSKRQSNQSTDSNAAFETRGLRTELEPRQTFRMRMGVTDVTNRNSGKELVYVEPYPDSAVPSPSGGMLHWDVNDGPRAETFGVEHVADNVVFKVSARFTVCVVECDPASTGDPGTAKGNKRGILSNRWSSSDDIDANQLTVRTYSGRLKVASSKINPHLLRSVVVPPLLQGLRRERMSFVVAADGKTMDWTVVDREMVAAAPYPSRSWKVSHTADTDQAMQTLHSVSVQMSGDRTANPRQMIAIACYVIREKLYSDPAVKAITKRFTIHTDTGEENSIQVSAEALLPSKAQNGVGIGPVLLAKLQTVGRPIVLSDLNINGQRYNKDISPGANAGDDIRFDAAIHLTGIFHARLQTPCDDLHNTDVRVPQNSQKPVVWPPEQPVASQNPGNGPAVDVQIVEDVWAESDSSVLSPGHQSAPYTSYTSESNYDTAGMMAAMPIARSTPVTTVTTTRSPTTSSIVSVPIVNNTNTGPGSGSEDTVKIIRLAAPVSKRIVRIRGERVGDWPMMPKPQSYQLFAYQVGSGNIPAGRAVVNDVRFLPGTTEMSPTGERLYRAHMEVEYLFTRPVDASQPLRVGNNPWDTLGLQMTTGAAMFVDEAATPGSGATA